MRFFTPLLLHPPSYFLSSIDNLPFFATRSGCLRLIPAFVIPPIKAISPRYQFLFYIRHPRPVLGPTEMNCRECIPPDSDIGQVQI